MTMRRLILGGMAAIWLSLPAQADTPPTAAVPAPVLPTRPPAPALAPDAAMPAAGWSGASPRPRPTGLALRGRTGITLRPRLRPIVIPDARWDHRPGGRRWTMAGLRAMAAHGHRLTDVVPRDIGQWCPGYREATVGARRAFWVGFLSALAYHESTWRADAVGGGGLWYGLLQIYPQTARHFRCRAQTGDALKDGAANVACAIRILNHTIPRDRAIALRDTRWRGVAADWGPMRDPADVAQMQGWTRRQPYCRIELAPRVSLRPLARPARPVQIARE